MVPVIPQLHLDFHRNIWQYRSRLGCIYVPILQRYSPALKGLQMERRTTTTGDRSALSHSGQTTYRSEKLGNPARA